MPQSTRWLIEVTAGNTPLQSFYETASTEMGALDKAKFKFRGIGGFGRVSEMGPLKFKATKVKANDRQARQHATKKAPTAASAGRRDAEIWMQETPESEWADALKPGVLGADESLINALGTAEAAKYLGVSSPYRNGNLTDSARTAFEQYARAYAKRISEALRSERTFTAHHATKKSSAQLQREIDEMLSRPPATDSFERAKLEAAAIEAEVDAAGAALRAFPRGPTGLTPDAVRATSAYRSAKSRYDRAFARQRDFNATFTKRFAQELRTERAQRDTIRQRR